ncbi:IS66 family transposase [Limnoglobus roseus]|uniref:IS66 family transposase n=1 Tax=Limnoglobus roseus TaxID=2598579 RepID=A0A5C1A648_9BACT|nr:IS66 family transposase [Limnoglobus roseus]
MICLARTEHARPVLDAFSTWLADQKRVALPSGLFGQAVTYATNQWQTLTRYLDDHRLAIDNGPAERALRPLALGRKNSYDLCPGIGQQFTDNLTGGFSFRQVFAWPEEEQPIGLPRRSIRLLCGG